MFKALAYAALLQGAGVAAFLSVFGAHLRASIRLIRSFGIAMGGLGLAAVLICYALEAGRMTGEVAGVMDYATQLRLAHLPFASVTSLRILGGVMLLIGLVWRAGEGTVLALIGAVVVTATFLLVGHSVSHQPRWAIVVLLQLHLMVAAFWVGSIVPLIVVARREPALHAHHVVERFSAMATVLVPAMAIAGMLMGWLLIGGHFTLRDPYTAMLTGKITLFIVALLLAALNRMRLGPALRAGTTLAVRRFSMSLAAELVILLAVVGLTATLTSLFSPPMLSAP